MGTAEEVAGEAGLERYRLCQASRTNAKMARSPENSGQRANDSEYLPNESTPAVAAAK